MSLSIRFSWQRKENLGIILAAFGISIIFQVPSTYHAAEILKIDVGQNLLLIFSVIFGISIVLTALMSATAEKKSLIVNKQSTVSSSAFLSVAFWTFIFFIVGYFLVFSTIQGIFYNELKDTPSQASYLSSQVAGTVFAGIYAWLVEKLIF